MPVIFKGNTGRVVSIRDDVAQGGISLGNVEGVGGKVISFKKHNSIITRIGVSASGNYQFLHTIGNDVYVYVFGDRMGEITLHGLSFAGGCSNAGPQSAAFISAGDDTNNKHGFELLFDWYQQSRIAVNPDPVSIHIGSSTVFKGFITGMSGDVNDSMTRTIQYELRVSLLPDAI